jgi:hypothetical protein
MSPLEYDARRIKADLKPKEHREMMVRGRVEVPWICSVAKRPGAGLIMRTVSDVTDKLAFAKSLVVVERSATASHISTYHWSQGRG